MFTSHAGSGTIARDLIPLLVSPLYHHLTPTSLDPTGSTRLAIRARQSLCRFTAGHALIQVAELGVNQAAILDRRRIAIVAIDACNKLSRLDLDVGERGFAGVLLAAVTARAVQFPDVLGVEVFNCYSALVSASAKDPSLGGWI